MVRKALVPCILALLLAGCRPQAKKSRQQVETPVERTPPGASKEAIETFVTDRWLEPQRQGNVDRYASLLVDGFKGTVLKATGEKTILGRHEWVKRRKKSLEGKPTISVEEIESTQEPGSDEIVVTFRQSYETDIYCDVGEKRLVLVQADASFLVRAEEMLTVEECPWGSPATFYPFARNYRRAWKNEDLDYIAGHTCMPFAYNSLIVRGGSRSTEEEKLERLGDLVDRSAIRDLLRGASIVPRTTTLRLGPKGCEYEVTTETLEDVAIVDVATTSCAREETFRLEFSFEDERWKLCSLRHQITHP
jgi:hypothetical protein